MVCLETHSIRLGDKSYPIIRIEVWFVVEGKGLFTTMLGALDVSHVIAPAPVAISENGIYEVLPPILERSQ